MDIQRIIDRYGDITGDDLDVLLGTESTIDVPTLLSMASEGSKAVVSLARTMAYTASNTFFS